MIRFQNLRSTEVALSGAIGHPVCCLLAAGLLAIAGASFAQTSDESFTRLKSLFAERKLELDVELSGARSALLLKYATAVDEVMRTLQAAGDLEGVVAARAESEAARAGSLLQRENVANLPPALIPAREVAEVEVRKGMATREANLAILRTKYLSALEVLKRDYTKAGDLETALAVAAEIAKETEMASSAPAGFTQSLSDLPSKLQEGLILWIPFDEEGAEHVTDISRSALVGVLKGTEFRKDGKIGAARYFDGADDQIDLGTQIPDSEKFTISVWMRYSGNPMKGGIFCDFNGVSGNDLAFSLLNDGSVHLRADKSGKNFQTILKLDQKPSDAWHHLVWVMDSRDSTVYLDGEVVGKVRGEGSNVGFHGAYIGRSSDGNGLSLFEGVLDEFMMWNRALNRDEVIELGKREQ